MSRLVLEPTADHPITIEPTAGRVLVKIAGQVVADTSAALTLEEAGYDPVQYIPIRDIDEVMLRPSDTTSYCPYKRDAGYFGYPVHRRRSLPRDPTVGVVRMTEGRRHRALSTEAPLSPEL